jgi:GxxExxY protein
MENVDEKWIIEKAEEIYFTLDRGLQECVYHKAFEVELKNAGISYESEKIIPIIYKNNQVGYGRADIVLKNIIIEFKAISSLPKLSEMKQINHYMKFLNIPKGIIINFGQPSVNQRSTIDYILIPNPSLNQDLIFDKS